jgi:LysR family transcriptional regulator, hydrogen peroxide-inducible genes activator
MIERHLLRYFLAVVDTGAFSRAASFCGVSQPTISSGIARLEKVCGHILLNRTNRRVELTAAGARLVPHARRIEAEFVDAQRSLQSVEPLRLIRIGIASTVSPTMIEWLINAFSDADKVRLEIVERRPSELANLIDRGRVDLTIGPSEGGSGRKQIALFSESYELAVAENSHLAKFEVLTCEQLVDEPMLVRRQCEALSLVSQYFTGRGVRPFMAARSASEERIAGYVRLGLGITVMPRSLVRAGIVSRPLIGLELKRTVVLTFDAASEARLNHGRVLKKMHDVFASKLQPD